MVWTIWADPDNSNILYTTTGKDEKAVRTLDTAMCAEVSRELTLRLLSGDGASLDAVDTSSEAYQTQYQKVYDALSKTDTKYRNFSLIHVHNIHTHFCLPWPPRSR